MPIDYCLDPHQPVKATPPYSEIVSDDAALDRAKAFIVAGLESGALKPRIARTFPLDAIQDAHRFLESNDQIGKVVVTV